MSDRSTAGVLGVYLGMYRAHVLVSPLAALVLFWTDHVVFTALFLAAAGLTWLGLTMHFPDWLNDAEEPFQ